MLNSKSLLLKRKFDKKDRIIMLLSVALIISMWWTFHGIITFKISRIIGRAEHRWTDVNTDSANRNLQGYRNPDCYDVLSWYEEAKVKCLVHDPTEIETYLRDFFPTFKRENPLEEGYHWEIGFYPMMYEESEGEYSRSPRLGFYIIPTIVKMSGTQKQVFDYWRNREKYPGPDGKRFIYDQGTVFP